MSELSQLMMPVQHISVEELFAKYGRTIIAPEMQDSKAYKTPVKRSRSKPNSVYGKGRERVLAYLQTHKPATTLTTISALSMHGDHTRRILRQLAKENLAICVDPGNRGERRPAIWTATEEVG